MGEFCEVFGGIKEKWFPFMPRRDPTYELLMIYLILKIYFLLLPSL